MLRVITSLGALIAILRGPTEERASTHLKLATVMGAAVLIAAALAVSINSLHDEPGKQAWWVRISPAPPAALLTLDQPPADAVPDRVLSAAVEPSPSPKPTVTGAPATPTQAPPPPAAPPVTPAPAAVQEAPPAPAAAPVPAVPPPTPVPTPTPPPGSLAQGLAGQLRDLINTERAAIGVAPLSEHGSLVAAAQHYAALHFLTTDPFQLSHHLDGQLIDRLAKHGYAGAGGEVLVTGPPDAPVLMDTWLNSPAHRDILLSAKYVHLGVGCYQGPYTNADGYTFDAVALCVADLGYPV